MGGSSQKVQTTDRAEWHPGCDAMTRQQRKSAADSRITAETGLDKDNEQRNTEGQLLLESMYCCGMEDGSSVTVRSETEIKSKFGN